MCACIWIFWLRFNHTFTYYYILQLAKVITCFHESVPPCDSAGPRWCPVLWLSRPAALRCDRGISAPNLGRCPWVTTANICETWETPHHDRKDNVIRYHTKSYEISIQSIHLNPLAKICQGIATTISCECILPRLRSSLKQSSSECSLDFSGPQGHGTSSSLKTQAVITRAFPIMVFCRVV